MTAICCRGLSGRLCMIVFTGAVRNGKGRDRMANASKVVNGLDEVIDFIQTARIPNGNKTARMIGKIQDAQKLIEEQEERIAIMSESCFPVFEIEAGHARTAYAKDQNGWIVLFLTQEQYAEPGTVVGDEDRTKEQPVFGYKVRDAKHAHILSEIFGEIARGIEKHEKENPGKTD